MAGVDGWAALIGEIQRIEQMESDPRLGAFTVASALGARCSLPLNGAVVTAAEDLLMRGGLSRAQAFGRLVDEARNRCAPLRLVAGALVGER